MSFLPTLRPGNIRHTLNLNDTVFGVNTDTFVYERDSRYIDLNKTNPCSGNSEIVAGLIKIYEPFNFAAPDSPSQATIASSQFGHDSRLELDIQVTNGSDNNFRIPMLQDCVPLDLSVKFICKSAIPFPVLCTLSWSLETYMLSCVLGSLKSN